MGRVSAAGLSRPLPQEVSLREIGNAMLVVARPTGGIEEELERDALAMFGGKRRTHGVRARLDAALQRVFERGLVHVSDAGVMRR